MTAESFQGLGAVFVEVLTTLGFVLLPFFVGGLLVWIFRQLFTVVVAPYKNPWLPDMKYEPCPRITFDRWAVTFHFHPEVGEALGDMLCLNFDWKNRREFGYWETWYDGPHKAFHVGPINVYWNWGPMRDPIS